MACSHRPDGSGEAEVVDIRLVGSTVEMRSPCREGPVVLCALEWAALSLLAEEMRDRRIPADAGTNGRPFELRQAEIEARRERAAQVERELLR